MCIVMGADTSTNTQPAASPGRWLQAKKRYTMKLLTTQKDNLFDLIERADLSPLQFEFQDVESQLAYAQIATKLKFKGTDYFYLFETSKDNLGNHFAIFCPGNSAYSGNEYTGTWEKHQTCFHKWLLNLRREISASNKWDRLSQEISGLNLAYENDSNRFTIQEFEDIQNKVTILKQKIILIGLPEEQINALNNKLDNLITLAKEMNKFDWKSLFIGTIISIIIQLSVTPENAKSIWEIIKQVFYSYFLP